MRPTFLQNGHMTTTFSPTGMYGTTVAHPTDCDGQDGLCAQYGCYEYVEVGVNVSNHNAVAILEALGIDVDPHNLYGTIDADDLRGRCLVALALADDSAIAPVTDRVPGQATYVDCGRREGYMSDRLAAILAVAEQAASLGVTVTYA